MHEHAHGVHTPSWPVASPAGRSALMSVGGAAVRAVSAPGLGTAPRPDPRPGVDTDSNVTPTAKVLWLPNHPMSGTRMTSRQHAVDECSPWFEYGPARDLLRMAFCGVLTPSTTVVTGDLGYCPVCYEAFLSLGSLRRNA